MLGFFKRPNIANLEVFNVRGNHDTYFNWTYELEVNLQQS